MISEKMCNRPWFKFWPKDVPRSINYPEIPLFQLLTDTSKNYPDKQALIYNNKRISYSELDQLSNKFANHLKNLGIKSGYKVMLFLPNIPEFIISYYGILKAGAIITAASPLSGDRELEYQLLDSDAKTIITTRSLTSVLEPIHKKVDLKNIIIVGEETAENYDGSPIQQKRKVKPKEDNAIIQYTGGTTGIPKGAMMSHFNLVANALQNVNWFKWNKDDIILAILPFCHTWSTSVCINSPILIGATIVLLDHFNSEEVLQTIEKEKVTICYGATTMFNILVNFPEIEKYDLSSLRLVKAGAMPIPEETKRKWDRLAGVELTLGYGLTEASPETHNSPPQRVKPGTVGIPISDTDAKIVDLETGTKELGPGEIGELLIKGPQVSSGYWEKSGETKSILKNGWLHTGDIAKMDEEGYFSIIDRKKDLIKYKGYSVFPAEIENVLYEHPGIKECLVIGKQIPEFGEIPKAFIVLKNKVSVTAKDLIKYCESKLAPYKKIREVEFVNELPRTPTGKPLRRILRDRNSSD